jgi:hypothetical protein
MVMKGKIKGIKRGQNIEIQEQINNIPDGSEMTIEFEITSSPNSEDKQVLTQESRLAKLNQLFGAWKDQPELIEIFAEIDKERHKDFNFRN